MAGPWEKYGAAEPQSGPWAKYGEPAKAEPSMLDSIKQGAGNFVAGVVRGAGSIGATITDAVRSGLADPAMAAVPQGMRPGVTAGLATTPRGAELRGQMDAALGNMGADTDSFMYGAGKLTSEIAGTAGAGGAIANAARLLPGAARAAPLLESIASGGMRAGGMTGAAGQAVRAAGGAVAGGAAAGLVNPEDAALGAVIGGAAPGVIQAAGAAGRAIGGTLSGPAPTPELLQAAQAARAQGYVMPPTQVRPTLTNRLMEGFSGKITTAQNASARNQTVTNRLAAETLGLPTDAPITRDAINAVRRQAGQAYDAVATTGTITPGPAYQQALDRIVAPYQQAAQGFPNAAPSPVIDAINALRSDAFDAGSAVAQLRNVRELADNAYAQGNRDIGRSLREGAEALENAIERHLQQTGNPQALQEFRDARRLIAQTYSVEKALNPTTGTVDARKLAAQVNKGRPMTGPMREAADFANRFPKAAQPIEGMGSLPQTSPLDWFSGAVLGSTVNPLAAAAVVARPATRAAILSGPMQNRMVQPGANRLLQLANQIPLEELATRSAPVIGAQ